MDVCTKQFHHLSAGACRTLGIFVCAEGNADSEIERAIGSTDGSVPFLVITTMGKTATKATTEEPIQSRRCVRWTPVDETPFANVEETGQSQVQFVCDICERLDRTERLLRSQNESYYQSKI